MKYSRNFAELLHQKGVRGGGEYGTPENITVLSVAAENNKKNLHLTLQRLAEMIGDNLAVEGCVYRTFSNCLIHRFNGIEVLETTNYDVVTDRIIVRLEVAIYEPKRAV